MNWYKMQKEDIFEILKTTERGLSDQEVKERLNIYGYNKFAEEESINKLKIFLHQFMSPLIYILLIAGIITIFLQEYIDASVIFIIVMINAIVGFIQEFKAEESVRALKKMVVPKAKVLRNGREIEINSEELLPGDIVILHSGDKVPADLRLIDSLELKMDESMLTGESLPVEKNNLPIKEENLTPGDQKNMAFMGTVVVSGRGRGVVVSIGSNTILGKIATDVKEAGIVKAPIQDKINRLASSIGLLVVISSAILFFIGILIGNSMKNMFLTAVAVAVAAIPEGLPIVVTVTMAVGVARMAKRNAIIRKLPAVETLGSTTVIGSDKTGTLTKNEMTVKKIYDGENFYEVTGSGYETSGNFIYNGKDINPSEYSNLKMTLLTGLLCNESNFYREGESFNIGGDPTEIALIVSALKAKLVDKLELDKFTQLDIIPFESERGYMATLNSYGDKNVILIKGAPEKIIELSGSLANKPNFDKETILKVAKDFAKEGLRVLAFAYKEVPEDFTKLSCRDIENCKETEGLIFAGLQGMMDPPRPEAIEAINGCKKAGIKVIMITGDHATTALAIGKMLGIAHENSDVITGQELEGMTNDEMFERIKNVSVYARVAPKHKLRIVELLKQSGEIVAVTGDGVNDAPALKAAHIGIAMGKSGTDVAKEASDMLLADDNFATIFNAVKEGRIVFDNIRKVIFFLLPTGLSAIISIMITIFMGIPIPYIPAQLLWINIVTNGLQDMALAFEPGEKNIENRPPRSPKEGIISRILFERTIIISILIAVGVIYVFKGSLHNGYSLEKARTMAVTAMVLFQFFQAWNSRSEIESIFQINPFSNMLLFFSLIVAFIAQIIFIYLPASQWIFKTESLTLSEWILIILVSISIIPVVEIDKFIRRKYKK